ncbi:4-carboxy-4-hydroxy-2-oxoadipate aldolase/oxaloacetate decarboxylase [Demequina zhanjiangensis]|uniref:Putative 4-hydroxy-4-methyl-2-oxoglutarate aldolase n=1 Tax=Demequina zhanjiangensis TaxID=3051659 RepID=A0ABT8G250_9MICO|nr:4-carboxy-4-hydroxy-2-oxoadipate aldolase/oxaloacetate decarboxylase [Demequina sp. SYSU T00b26]MDN4473215.1 4-carboxy-4-hydroxy-2-oxoadipate aldolase/oxaloacetate decarboxylase [Demequina sp. SYSU T00b26]
METVILTDPPKPPRETVEGFAGIGAATVGEALGRTGDLGSDLRPIQTGARIVGTAVTVLSWPGDNLMIHAAIEQCGPGDILVVVTRSPSQHGMFGELFATGLQHRGVAGAIIDAGVRDTQELRDMGFPVWARHINVLGTVKNTPGAVNVPVVINGQVIDAGDILVCDDDGIVVVPRGQADDALAKSRARLAKEEATRASFLKGELGLDRYGMRPVLADLGVTYRRHPEAR